MAPAMVMAIRATAMDKATEATATVRLRLDTATATLRMPPTVAMVPDTNTLVTTEAVLTELPHVLTPSGRQQVPRPAVSAIRHPQPHVRAPQALKAHQTTLF